MSLWTNGSSVDLLPGTQTPTPDSNSSSNRTDGSQHRGAPGAAPLDLSRAVPVGMVLASFIMFAIVGNILVILSVICNRHLRIPTNYFIINLAIADLLLGTTVLPVSATLEVGDRSLIDAFLSRLYQQSRKRRKRRKRGEEFFHFIYQEKCEIFQVSVKRSSDLRLLVH